jgi:hypothetical protein
LGGKPTVANYNTNAYDITIPGLSNAAQTIPQVTPYATNLGAEATTDASDSVITVQTFNASGNDAAGEFFFVIYGASPNG